jgi:hypothetical protein
LHHETKKEIKDMVEAKLRVETTEYRNKNTMGDENPFYGNSLVKKVTEETFYHDKDVRTHIAPRGIKATLMVGDVVMDITINKYYLEHEATDDGLSRYIAFFGINDKVYEVCVWFDIDNKIKDVSLSEWLQIGYFENGDNADNIYWLSENHFTTIVAYLG